MGDPRKIRKKYQTPSKRWEKARIDEERPIMRNYGLKNKKELWKMGSLLRGFRKQAKLLIAGKTAQADREKQQLFTRLQRYGLLKQSATLDDVLGLGLGDILERRLQTLVYKKGFARTIDQARQMIVHQHITIGGKKMTAPSHLVQTAEEPSIAFVLNSQFASPDHAERTKPAKAPEKERPKEERRGRKPRRKQGAR